MHDYLVEADRVRVLPSFAGAGPVNAPAPIDRPVYVDAAPAPAPPASPLPPEPAPAPAQPQINMDGLIRTVDAAKKQILILGDDNKRCTADVAHTDIILPGMERAGQIGDLAAGTRVHLVGVTLPSGELEADRLRVLPAAPTPPAPENMDAYTGILIDARNLPRISRSPAPAVYGPLPDQTLLYPDRSHVPTPDEVQEESIVRYYWTVEAADSGVAGSNPMILTPLAVLGPAQDAVQLSSVDADRFLTLNKRLHFTQTWKVGFLMPADH